MSDFGDDDDGFGGGGDDDEPPEDEGEGDDYGDGEETDGSESDDGQGDDYGDGEEADGSESESEEGDASEGEDEQEEGARAEPTWGEDDAAEEPAVGFTEDVYGAAEDWPDAAAEDFEDDAGDWTPDDYEETAQALFGSSAYYNESPVARFLERGFSEVPDAPAYAGVVDRIAPGLSSGLSWLWDGGRVVPQGFVPRPLLAVLMGALPYVDWSMVHVSLPGRLGPRWEPVGLPPELAAVDPRDSVDLRRYASPVGDQGDTSRCAAFAWTHAVELAARVAGGAFPELSCNFTMLRFQQRQRDARDFAWAYEGGDGTQGSVEPGQILVDHGTCRAEMWPNHERGPRAPWEHMVHDAGYFRLAARVQMIALDDAKRVLTAGNPIQLSMTTGEAFSGVGRDGVIRQAEPPSGRHGYHAMLCVGYTGNYFIVKNSWGVDWGDAGYCYVPKRVIAESEPELVAVLVSRGAAPPGTGGQRTAVGGQRTAVGGQRSADSGQRSPRAFCDQCGQRLASGGRFCMACGARVPP